MAVAMAAGRDERMYCLLQLTTTFAKALAKIC